jgi:acetyl-CoA C-acetyltransferase/acetyl-CoA acyltransferase
MKIYAAGGGTSTFMGPGRKEFDPKNLPSLKDHLKETIEESLSQLNGVIFDEGIVASFMPGQFTHQGHLGAFLPAYIPSLLGKACWAVDGACGSGGRAITSGIKSLLSGETEAVFVAGVEIQNTMKPLYVADVLAGASDYDALRKEGEAYFFPSLFDKRAQAYINKYGEILTREAMAVWTIQEIHKAQKFPKSQEYGNVRKDLEKEARTQPNSARFLSCLNPLACSKISDGAASIGLFTKEALLRFGIKKTVEIIAWGEAEGDITKLPEDLTILDMTALAVQKALQKAHLKIEEIGYIEIHDCFAITALLAIEALGLAAPGKGGEYILEGKGPHFNLTGGLIGFGHPTGATGVRQLVDLSRHLHSGYGLLVSMGGDDKTVTALIVKVS